jgi:hypothetical protein
MNTKERGDIAVGFAISYYLSHGYEVCLPIGDKRPYDLIVEREKKLLRVQIKYAGFSVKKNRCQAGLRITGGNQSYTYAKKYSADDFDALFIYTEKAECYIIPWKVIDIRNELTIDAEKYSKYRVN